LEYVVHKAILLAALV